jgi:hypothetical protein
MNNKKSFLLYLDQQELFNKLPDEVAGKLIKHIFSYVNCENPEAEDILLDIAFSSIKQALKRDLAKWDSQIKQRSDAGKKSAKKRANEKQQALDSVKSRSTNSTDSDSVSVNDSVSVSVSVSDTDKHKQLDILVQSKIDREKLVQDAFVYFWSNMFLPKKAKPVGEKAFIKAIKKVDDPMHFAKFLVTDTETRFNNQQIGFDKMHPSTYLNQARWEDDHTIDKPKNQKVVNDDSDNWERFDKETF